MRTSVVAAAAAAVAAVAIIPGALSGANGAEKAAEKLKVGFVYLGPVGDMGWTYQHEAGRQGLMKDLGDKIETTYLENVPEGPDAERSIEQLVRSGHKLIFTTRLHGPDAQSCEEVSEGSFRARHRLQARQEHGDLLRSLV
jgi:basic membrane lipoprotein Med (substrate-binding protein (PBP1-ABC) superfamily)